MSSLTGSEIVVSKPHDEGTVAQDEDFDKSEVPPASFYLKQRKILINMLVMSIIWLATSFGYYLILSLINTFDKVYVSGLTSSASEMIAYVLSGLLYERIGVKLSFIIAFSISAFGGILILSWGLQHESSIWFFVCFLLTKFGVTCTFNINFVANSYFFPTLFAATALGVCNFLARLASAFSYLVSEMDEPAPMYLFTGLCIISAICSFFLKIDEKDVEEEEDVSGK